MIKEIKFGEEHTESIVRVYDEFGTKIGIIKKQDNKPKWIWKPSYEFQDSYPFTILDPDLVSSKQIVHKFITT